jgi:hypothetical protein
VSRKRTIAAWSTQPDIVIRPELQRALDTAYERAGEPVKFRFARQLKADDDAEVAKAGSAIALTVAIAVVVNDDEVLLVCRREPEPGLEWQALSRAAQIAYRPHRPSRPNVGGLSRSGRAIRRAD